MTVQQAAPFVFLGLEGGNGPCAGEPDQVDGPNIPANNGCFHGGGFNSATFWSPSAGAFVPIPERWTEIEDNWNQKVIRVCTVSDGDGGAPGPITTSADVIDAVNEALAVSGMYLLIEHHGFTGDDKLPEGAFNKPTPTSWGAQSWDSAVKFWDEIVQAFAGNDRVWFNFSNEPGTGTGPTASWTAQAEWWLRRARLFHNATNIVVLDLNDFGQDLDELAAGSYDAWWAGLGALTDNVVLGWHAYGARAGQAYTYATMDADLLAVHQKGYPIIVGEYGQSSQVGSGNAGPDAWNRVAVECLVTNNLGPALVDKYQLLFLVWIATGDATFWHSYKLTQGPTPGVDGLSIPVWDITAAEANSQYLEPLGQYHWDESQTFQ